MVQNPESVLLKASSNLDVQCSGGFLSITGLSATPKNRISAITQIKSRTEVVQVVKVGGTSYTPTSNTLYTVEFGDINRLRNGAQERIKRYSFFLTTATGVAATDRETIHAALVVAINNDSSNFVTAVSLGTGTGFTITDAAGYFPVFNDSARSRKGATLVRPCTNPDGTGFLSTNVLITTAAVYAFGQGADLAASVPTIDILTGNLLSGYLKGSFAGIAAKTTGNLPAVSGQAYDAFIIYSLSDVQAHNQTGQTALIPKVQYVFVDNGTGSATTNAAGFATFERDILRHIFAVYDTDPNAISDFFDGALIASATYPTTGALISTTDNVVMSVHSGKNQWFVNPNGTHTLLTPIVTATGLSLLLDVADDEGIELTPPNLTSCLKGQFVVGKQEFSLYAKMTATNYAHLEEYAVGFRKKTNTAVNQNYAATPTAYDAAGNDFAILGQPTDTPTGLQSIATSLAAGGMVTTSTTKTFTSGAHDYEVRVDINGLVHFYLDGVELTSKQTTQFSFAAGAVVIPFIMTTLDANADAAPFLVQVAALPTINWRN